MRLARTKIASLEHILAETTSGRKDGATIALANGCFDVLHVGHVRYLEAARQEASRLVVAVNSDESVRRLKGSGRPILPAEDRALIVAALRCVDHVVVFEEDDVRHIIRALRPDVHCKGTDYTEESVPERETVLACGGRVAIVGDQKAHDTRALLSRVRQ